MLDNDEKNKWKDFRKTGLLWFINSILHLFGYAITYNCDSEGNIISVTPERVFYRGFTEETNTEGYEKVTKYLGKEIKVLLEDLEK